MNFPEGFFRTTEEVFEEVASYPVVPGEKLWQYWNVYTTTYRRGNDPTASRLESFWWHVMGSDRRLLSGKTLAKIYEEISTGPTFTPLRRPSNRFHQPVLPRITQTQPEEAGNGTNAQSDSNESSQKPLNVPTKPTPDKPKDALASSSSRPPPPHPILKKVRGPSTSGPRPTARFVSPHDSEDETAKEDDESSGSLAATGLHMHRSAKSPVKGEKKSTPTGRKFTASSSAKRHVRPALPRRQSSQSSAEPTAKLTPSSAGSSKSSAGGRSLSVEQTTPSSLASSGNSALGRSPAPSAKAAGKRPVKAPQATEQNTNRGSVPGTQSRAPPPVIVQHPPQAAIPQAASMERSRSHETRGTSNTTENRRSLLDPSPRGGQAAAPMMARSQSNIEHPQHRPREIHSARPLPQSMITPKSTPVIKKAADVAVQVQFESESVTAQGSGGGTAKDLPDSITIASRPSTSSLYTPTQPSPTPAPFLGRSKSQLTLLLEKMDQKKGKGLRDHL
ncbi:hypothetical protein GE09DRAFT_1228662 [Coniochaeta sp. 2T2.1]|nr:hypothetical protein GE09DRAFT_1228662 [Coniochaeta sp. 2T2.1]